MDNEIKHLRKKFFLLSSIISFIVIFVMMLILNILMQMTYKNEMKAAADMLAQTASSNVSDAGSEIIFLKDTQINQNGYNIIPRNPATIKKVILNGTISCTDPNADWYCAGGGLFFELPDSEGKIKYIHKEYKFNRDNTKIIIDFTDDSDFLYNGNPLKTDITKVSPKHFFVSEVWWASSSTNQDMGPDEDVKLELESIELQYLSGSSAASSENYVAVNRDFNEIYPDGLPDTLNNYRCFYLIADKQGNLLEVNNGNTLKSITQKNAYDIINSGKESEIIDNKEYKRKVVDTEKYRIYLYISDKQAEQSTSKLLLISALSGGSVFVLVLILINYISGIAVKPISESYQKQKDFISNASHELKTPITVISATAELMEKKNGSDRLTECLYVQANKMGRLVNEMLTLTRLSASENVHADFKAFNISRTVENAVLYFESRAFEEQKQIITDIDENLNFTGNADKIDELTGILLDNALKYSDEKSDIRISLHSAKEKLILSCKNPCKDFDVRDIPHLFDRFYRGDKSRSGEKSGFGLGLSIAREIAAVHKGTIKVDFNENIISFTVIFTVKEA